MIQSKNIVTVSKYTKSKWISNGIPKKKIIVEPSGVDLKKFENSKNLRDIRNKLNLPINNKIVLYSGQLHDWKGIDTLIESCCYLGKGITVCILGGSKKDISNYMNFAKEKQLSNNTQCQKTTVNTDRIIDRKILKNILKQKIISP